MPRDLRTHDLRASLEHGARRMNRTARDRMLNADVVWYALFALSGKEFVTQRALRHWDAYAYLPLCRKWRRLNRYRREKVKVAYPAVAGCLFVGFERGRERWFDIFRAVRSIYGILGINGRPITLDGSRLMNFISDNRVQFDAAEEEKFMRTHHEFKIGDRVQIVEGPFDGHIVDVNNITGRNAHILIHILGGKQYVDIPLDKLEKAA